MILEQLLAEDELDSLRHSELFDEDWYLNEYPDVGMTGLDPAMHYIWIGVRLNRRPSADAIPGALLGAAAGQSASTLEVEASHPLAAFANDGSWPPLPVNDFWPPQIMRDFFIEGYGERGFPTYWYLMSVMAAWCDDQAEFANGSCELDVVVRRLRELAAARLEHQARVSNTEEPDASIIIPVHNNLLDTLLCLVSVLESAGHRSFEVLVADDASSDGTERIVSEIGGNVAYFRQPENLGFLKNCNASAERCSGRYVVLLNNDTLVMPGWLDALLAPFDSDASVGLTGSKLINWDGTLQEAGGIFWEDGSAWNFGRGAHARDPQFNYVKDVDYCSGASIALPRTLWDELGGFDEHYLPAYCEDSDLAFRVRAKGRRSVYMPFSEVIHHEGRSHGRDTSSGIKAYQVLNQAKFVERWGDVLRQNHNPNAVDVLRARDRSRGKRHVLFIDHYVPQWDRDAGSRTIFQYMKLLVDAGLSVSFWPDNLHIDPKYTPALQALGIEVIYGPQWVGRFGHFIAERCDLYDMVFISRPHVAKNYIADIRAKSSAQIFFYGQDLHFKRMQAAADIGEDVQPEDIAATKQLELEICATSDVIFYPDPEEVDEIRELVGGDRQFLANPVFVYKDNEIAESRSKLGRLRQLATGRLLFVGGFNHTPNRDGIIWFANEVFPLIAKQYPEALLDIAGSNPPPEVIALGGPKVVVHGFVSDERLYELYETTDIVVAPLRFGAGVKGKVIEAMARGAPVATTSFGAQGIDNAPSMMFLGNTKDELADAVVEALSKRETASRRAARALDFIGVNYSESSLRDLFLRLLATK